MSRVIKVGAAQTGPVQSDDMRSMVPTALRMIEEARKRGVDILTFCELFLSPFFPNRLIEDFDRFFTAPDSDIIREIREAARDAGLALILPFGERANSGMYNAAMILDRSGRNLGTYRKTHIPAYFPNEKAGGTGSYEKFYFTPGESLPVFDVDGVKIGVQICNDRLYPEPSRVLALQGAEIIFMPICYSVYSDPEHRNAIWDVALRARAFENGVFVVAANKVGAEGVRRHLGRSMVVDPRGSILAEAGTEGEELIVCEIDLDRVSALRKKFPWWRDRRPDLYRLISQ
ncbi:MAG TPA: carbon-nitrogen hydrolase family protein [Alphaproteobacteria bacterium]|nr:carbon-nitrogen hydrolase family protein [Alphaproteobacteria bacterium]